MGTMATQSPFLLLEDFLQGLALSKFAPPEWLIDESQHRIVLLLNHILSRENEAMTQLARQQGRVIHVQWRSLSMKLIVTPAGLLDRAATGAKPDLALTLSEDSPVTLASASLRGDRPALRIEGDVQLAADVNWLVEHVRWDIEDDLSRVVGDAAAHALGQAARAMLQALRKFSGLMPTGANDKAAT